jgi:hypothetical protein
MYEPAEDLSPSDSRASCSFHRGSGVRRSKIDAPVWPGPVVVLGVCGEDAFQVTPSEDEDVVEALPTNGADPTLREGPSVPERVSSRR